MPLRDHFRPPVSRRVSWEEIHGGWPMVIVQQLRKQLPPGFVSAPTVHAGSQFEIDIATHERDDSPTGFPSGDGDGGVATVAWTVTEPSVAIETEIPDYDEYEVRIYDADSRRPPGPR